MSLQLNDLPPSLCISAKKKRNNDIFAFSLIRNHARGYPAPVVARDHIKAREVLSTSPVQAADPTDQLDLATTI